MHTIFTLPERYRGHVSVSNEDGAVVEGHNDVVYQGGDILAALAAGKSNYKISHMYFEFQNTSGSTTADPFALTDTAISRQGVVSPYDLVRAPLIAVPTITAADGNHAGNHVVFHALTNASVGLNGLPFSAAAHSKVISMCLVAAPGGSDELQDLVYARYVLGTALPVSGSGQIAGAWPTTWT